MGGEGDERKAASEEGEGEDGRVKDKFISCSPHINFVNGVTSHFSQVAMCRS